MKVVESNSMEVGATPSTVALTGATSFLGRALIRHLLATGGRVVAIARPESSQLDLLPADAACTVLLAGADKLPQLAERLREQRCQALVNLAWAASHHGERDNEEANRRNIDYALAAMRLAAEAGCHTFVQAGSQAEYGYQGTLTDEQAPLNPFTAYGRCKAEVWRQGALAARQLNIAYLHERIFSVYGEGDHPYTLFATCLDRMARGETIPLTAGTQLWDFLYVDDWARLTAELLRWSLSGQEPGEALAVNLASGDARCLCEWVVRMKVALGSPSRLDFGAVPCERPLSLRPDVARLRRMLGGELRTMPWEEGVLLSASRRPGGLGVRG